MSENPLTESFLAIPIRPNGLIWRLLTTRILTTENALWADQSRLTFGAETPTGPFELRVLGVLHGLLGVFVSRPRTEDDPDDLRADICAHPAPEADPTAGERECRYPCDCGQFDDEHCSCMEGHATPDTGDASERLCYCGKRRDEDNPGCVYHQARAAATGRECARSHSRWCSRPRGEVPVDAVLSHVAAREHAARLAPPGPNGPVDPTPNPYR